MTDTAKAGSAYLRFVLATNEIESSHVTLGGADDEIVRRHGFAGMDEYWQTALAHPMKAPKFVRLLEFHLLDPEQVATEIKNKIRRTNTSVKRALEAAKSSGEPWLYRDEDGQLFIKPREAVQWLRSSPQHLDCVPTSLASYLSGTDSSASSSVAQAPAEVYPGADATIEERFLTWAQSEVDAGRGPPDRHAIGEWAKENGMAARVGRDFLLPLLPPTLRLKRGESRASWRTNNLRLAKK